MLDIEVIDDPEAAAAALAPVRSRLLAELAEPASAATLAERLAIPRQKVNYHLKTLEQHKLIEVADTRKWGGITERLLVGKAKSYVVSPATFGAVAPDPRRATDHLSASYAIALAARVVREVGALWRKARLADKRLATLSIDTEVRFRSPAERANFARELTEAVTTLVGRYHDGTAKNGRTHRVVLLAHPAPPDRNDEVSTCP